MKLLLLSLLVAVAVADASAAIRFNGTTQFLSVNSSTSPSLACDPTSDTTLAVWLKKHSTGLGSITESHDNSSHRANELRLNNTSNVLEFVYTAAPVGLFHVYTTAPNFMADTGVWHHVCVTISYGVSPSNIQIYKDGVLQTGGGWTQQTGTNNLLINSGVGINLGGGGASGQLGCTLDEFCKFDVILTPTQVRLLAASKVRGIPMQIPGCVVYLPLNEFQTDVAIAAPWNDKSVTWRAGNKPKVTPTGSPISKSESLLSNPAF